MATVPYPEPKMGQGVGIHKESKIKIHILGGMHTLILLTRSMMKTQAKRRV